MSNLFFGGMAYNNEADLAMAVASEYLVAGGMNDLDEINQALLESNETLIDEIKSEWNIESSAEDLAAAFDEIRKNPESIV